ncbi:MAG TPA: transposase [Bacteroidales bacterium]|nr:transposase [Bacteroidales bacterium]
MQSILGIDVSKKTLDVVLMINHGVSHKVIKNDSEGYRQLEGWLEKKQSGKVHACLEATGQYGEDVAEYLFVRGHQVSVVNPARIKRYGESKLHRNKTDKADAALIAEFCQKEKPGLWQPLSPEIKRLRALVRRLQDQKANLQQEKNRLESGEKDLWVVHDLKAHVDYLGERIRATENEIDDLIDQSPDLKFKRKLLTSIPGIGHLTAHILLAEIGDISRFDNAPQLAAFAGLNPQGHRSGTSVYKKTRISKQGRSELRCCLYMPAIVAMYHNPVIQDLSERMVGRDSHKMEIVVASMRKLLHIAYGVLKNQIPFDPEYGKQFNFA